MRTQSSVQRNVAKRVNRSRTSTGTRTTAAKPAPAIVARKPRTSLIDAEWEWLALRADVPARSSREVPGPRGRPAFMQHTKTLPPPPFQPHAAPRPLPSTEDSETLKSASSERAPEISVRSRRAPTMRMLGVLVATALTCFAAGVGLLHGAASLVERGNTATGVDLAARIALPTPPAPTVEAPTLPAPAAVEAPAQVAAATAPIEVVSAVAPPAPATPPVKAKRAHGRWSAAVLAAKKRKAPPQPASDNPY